MERQHEFESLSKLSPESGCIWLFGLFVGLRGQRFAEINFIQRGISLVGSFLSVANRFGTGCDR